MAAEFEPHIATWLTWPQNPQTWPGNMEPIPGIWVQMISALHHAETVHINVNDEQTRVRAMTLLLKAGVDTTKIIFHPWPTNDCWMRDCGPCFVEILSGTQKKCGILDWEFNMWGAKYPPWNLDNQIPARVAKYLGMEFQTPGIVLEGGSIDVNGRGTLLTTESCLLNKNRNPHLTKNEIENYLKKYLGVSHIIWLGDGIVGDDTDGHVDDLSRFVDPTTVVTVVEDDPQDRNYRPLLDNLTRLKNSHDQNGRQLRIVKLPMPRPIFYEGRQLPASYANFYIANKVVLVPVFDDPQDRMALATLKPLFPSRKIIGIAARDLVWGLGAFHCVTREQPKISLPIVP